MADHMIEFTVETPEDIELQMEELRVIHAVSPSAEVERFEDGDDKGVKITVSDINGITEAFVYDGKKGDKGDKGDTYVLTDDDRRVIAATVIDDTLDSSSDKTWSVDKITDKLDETIDHALDTTLEEYVKKTDYATAASGGVVKINDEFGLKMLAQSGVLAGILTINAATSAEIKSGNNSTKPLSTLRQHESTFYGLAKAAGDATQERSANTVGTYTPEAKTAIQTMLGVPSTTDLANAVAEAERKNLQIHICSASEYDAATGIPTVANPDAKTFYLVPDSDEGNNLYIEWVYVNRKWEQFGSATIDLSNYVQKTDYASTSNAGVVRLGPGSGLSMEAGVILSIVRANSSEIKTGTNLVKPIVPVSQHQATFYGLAKAAGDTTQSQSDNPVGTYTNEAKTAIRTMLDVPATSDIPEAPVQDVQVNGTSILQNGIANIPKIAPNTLGVMVPGVGFTIEIDTGTAHVSTATNDIIKMGTERYMYIDARRAYASVFYGLAKAAGDTSQSASSNTVGTYTPEAQSAIQTMLDVPSNADLTQAITNVMQKIQNMYICSALEYNSETGVPTVANPDSKTFYLVPSSEGSPNLYIEWVYLNNTWERFGSATIDLSNYVQFSDYASASDYGVVKIGGGFSVDNGRISISGNAGSYKGGTANYIPVTAMYQHYGTFYGLAKAAGVDMAASDNPVGTYTDPAKTAIRSMLGVENCTEVVRLI